MTLRWSNTHSYETTKKDLQIIRNQTKNLHNYENTWSTFIIIIVKKKNKFLLSLTNIVHIALIIDLTRASLRQNNNNYSTYLTHLCCGYPEKRVTFQGQQVIHRQLVRFFFVCFFQYLSYSYSSHAFSVSVCRSAHRIVSKFVFCVSRSFTSFNLNQCPTKDRVKLSYEKSS